jgi:hypothetical protein
VAIAEALDRNPALPCAAKENVCASPRFRFTRRRRGAREHHPVDCHAAVLRNELQDQAATPDFDVIGMCAQTQHV